MIDTAASIITGLRLVSGTGSGRSFELCQDRVSIGRDASNVVCLSHATVSRQHAILVRTGEHYKVRDLISTNGTYINGERTTEAELHNGDVLRFGEVEMRYEEVRLPVAAPKAVPSQTALPLARQPTSASPTRAGQYKIVGADGRTYGPADAALVRKWISQGFANGQTWVPAEARGNWRHLGEFPEFADALVGITTPTNLLGTPSKDALWEEPVKVGPSADLERIVTLEQVLVAGANRQKATRTSFPIFVGVLLLLALAGAVAAWWFDQWPFDARGPLRRYERSAEGYIYSDPDYVAAAKAENAKDYAAVLKNARQLVSHYPSSSLAHCILGVAYGKLGSYSNATVAFQQAIKLKPDYINAWNNLGWAYSQSGRFAEAVGAFQQLIKFAPNDAQVWSNLGGAQAGQGHEADAIAAYQMAIQLKPDYADAHFNLGAAYANQGKLVDAVNSFRLAVTYKPDFPEAWFNLGVVSSRQGENNKAVIFFQKAINLRPNYAGARDGLAKAYENLGQSDKVDEATHELRRLDAGKPANSPTN
jgi:tetratricopeptide (TPR) repeat protein